MQIGIKASLIFGTLSCLWGCRTTSENSLILGLAGCANGAAVEPDYSSAHVTLDLASTAHDGNEEERAAVGAKTPALIYMAIDTDEPFMKLSVDHEVRALRTACDSRDKKVNWIAFVNSLLTTKTGDLPTPIVVRCDGGVTKIESLPPAAIQALETKRDLYAAGDSCNSDRSVCLRIRQNFFLEKGSEFRQFPLAHPDIILDMLEYARTLYPPDQFAYFLHIKSHGSENFLTTGLGPEQVKEKSECQVKIIKKYRDDHPEESVAGSHGSGPSSTDQVGLGQVGLGQVGLGQVGLGQVGLGQVGLGQVGLGQVGLGQVGLGRIGGLGLGVAGLNASNHYGSRHLSALLALRWFTTRGAGKEDLAFVFFESCESRASRFVQHESLNCALPPSQNPLTAAFNNAGKVDAYYSAAESLWYRNLDWDTLYSSWLTGAKTTATFQSQLIEISKLIPNYNFSGQDPLPLCQ